MPSAWRILAYGLAAIPAAIGIAFVARYAYVTSDTAIDGAGNAFLFGMIAAGAFAGPAVVVALVGNERKLAAGIFAVLAAVAMVTNWSHTLGAVAHRGAGTEAEHLKAKDNTSDNRATRKRLEDERGAMSFVPATAEAVHAAREAVTAAERNRIAECGLHNEKRGVRCRDREADEQSKRDALAIVQTRKDTTDKAAKLDSEIAALRTALATAPAPKEGNSLGNALSRILRLSATTAATLQQGLVSAIVELLIAAALALPELLRKPHLERASSKKPGQMLADTTALPFQQIEPPKLAAVGDVRRFMLGCLPQATDQEASWGAIYARYQRWCAEQSPVQAPLDLESFANRFGAACGRFGVRTRREGGKVYCVGVQLVA